LAKAVIESCMLTDAGDRCTAAGPLVPLASPAIPASLQPAVVAIITAVAAGGGAVRP
jgi:hypothetical protein